MNSHDAAARRRLSCAAEITRGGGRGRGDGGVSEFRAEIGDGFAGGFEGSGKLFDGFDGDAVVERPGFGVRGNVGLVVAADEVDFVVGGWGFGVESEAGEAECGEQGVAAVHPAMTLAVALAALGRFFL